MIVQTQNNQPEAIEIDSRDILRVANFAIFVHVEIADDVFVDFAGTRAAPGLMLSVVRGMM